MFCCREKLTFALVANSHQKFKFHYCKYKHHDKGMGFFYAGVQDRFTGGMVDNVEAA